MHANLLRAALAALCLAPVSIPAQEPTPEQNVIDYANGLFARELFAEAAGEYESYLKAFPEGPHAAVAYLRLGESATAARDYQKALDTFTQALARNLDEQGKYEAQLGAAEALLALKRPGEAIAQLTPLSAEAAPPAARARALYALGRAHGAKNDTAKAIECFQRLIDTLPDSPLALYAQFQLGMAYVNANDLENAATRFSAVANAAKAGAALRAECRYRAAEIYDKLGWHEAALGAYEKLRAEFPDSPLVAQSNYPYAWGLYRGGQYEKALAMADAFLREAAGSALLPGALYLRANALQQLQRFDDALAAYTQLRAEHANSEFAAPAQYKMAWCYQLKGDAAAAKREAGAFIEAHADDALSGDAAYLLGIQLLGEGNYEIAQQQFKLVAEKYPKSEFAPDALYKAAECQSQLGLSAQASAAFAEFAKLYPANPLAVQAFLRGGDAQFQARDYAGAAKQYEAMLAGKLEPPAREAAIYRLAIARHNAGNFKDSAAAFAQLAEEFPATGQKVEALFRMGDYALREAKDPLKAIERFQAAYDADPKGGFAGEALRGLALARYEHKDHEQAAALFLRVMREFPDLPLNEETYAWAGQYSFDQQHWDDALFALRLLLEKVKGYPYPERIHFTIAECLDKSGAVAEALKAYQAVADAAPTSTKAIEACFRMGALYEKQKEAKKAVALYEQAANASGGEAAAQASFRLGELLEESGEHDKAARSFMRIAILFLHETLSPEALWRAGGAFERAGKPDQARKAYGEIVSDYPKSPHLDEAKAALDRIGKP